MRIEQTIVLRADIPDDATVNHAANGEAVSFTLSNGETIRFQAIVEVETPDGECCDLNRHEYVQLRGIDYDYVDAHFKVIEEGPANAAL